MDQHVGEAVLIVGPWLLWVCIRAGVGVLLIVTLEQEEVPTAASHVSELVHTGKIFTPRAAL